MGLKPDAPEQQGETPYQKELAKIAREKWGKYQGSYVPIENEYMERVDAMGDQWQADLATGSANKAVQTGYSEAQDQMESSLFKGGINPNSGKFEGANAELAADKQESGAEAQGDAAETQRTRHAEGIQSVVNMGQGQSIDAQIGITDVARTSANKASSDASNSYSKQASRNQTIGTGLGMAASAGMRSLKQSDGSGVGTNRDLYGETDPVLSTHNIL